jgi:predicted metal-dependent hydrolase
MPELTLADGTRLPYELKRSSKRRSIGLRISEQGLVVSIPQRLSLRELEALLQSKRDWIQEKVQQQVAAKVPAMRWQHGENLWLLGSPMPLYLAADSRNRAISCDGSRIDVCLTDITDSAMIKRRVTQWYKQQALADFSRRTELLIQKLGLPTPPITLSSARSRWGSCNSKGEIRLNWRLIQAPPHIIQYVIAHELAHLKEMNHSSRFWAIVAQLFPSYRHAEAELRQLSRQLHRID